MRVPTLILLLFTATCSLAGELRLAVASNFRTTADVLNARFAMETGVQPGMSTASTGVLHNQISHGAPFDLFLSADRASPRLLDDAGHGVGGQRFCYAVGELILLGGAAIEDLANPQLSLAIANPETAPYGRAAQMVLARADFRAGKGRKLVRGNNVVQAYQYWHSGAVDLALVARSLAPQEGLPVPAHWHGPLTQEALLLTKGAANPLAVRYVDFLRGDNARALISAAGYRACP